MNNLYFNPRDDLKNKIISWYFDGILDYFVIKRRGIIQYFSCNRGVFSTLPEFEIVDLARMNIVWLDDKEPASGMWIIDAIESEG